MNWFQIVFWITFTLIMGGSVYVSYLIIKKHVNFKFFKKKIKRLKDRRLNNKIIKSLKLYKSKTA